MITKTGMEMIAQERVRQVDQEGWTAGHDDGHDKGQIAAAAIAYTARAARIETKVKVFGEPHCTCGARGMADCTCVILQSTPRWAEPWPWEKNEFNPKDPVRDLVRAGALIAAEIDRLLRKQEREKLNAAAEEERP